MDKRRATEFLEYLLRDKNIKRTIYEDALNIAIESLKAQLSNEGTTSDLISRRETIERFNVIRPVDPKKDEYTKGIDVGIAMCVVAVKDQPAIQPVATDIYVGDKISKFIDGLEEIFADLREKHVDDSVCGLCEYDGAYIGQSGDWCNECPGFERDDCFKLSDKTRKKWTDEIIKALPTVQPDLDEWCTDCREYDKDRHSCPRWNRVIRQTVEDMKAAQPELTDEQAITHLQSSGWMQRHDKEMYESGLREQLADDSDSYDSLLPNVQSDLIEKIQAGITATNLNDAYSLGMRNGMRWCKSLIDGAEPKFEDVTDSAELLSVQPEPQEGHWIRTDCGLDVECKCSVCGYKDFVEPHDTYWFKRNYCPNCGVRMKGECE